jgi:hypothetical protein
LKVLVLVRVLGNDLHCDEKAFSLAKMRD